MYGALQILFYVWYFSCEQLFFHSIYQYHILFLITIIKFSIKTDLEQDLYISLNINMQEDHWDAKCINLSFEFEKFVCT